MGSGLAHEDEKTACVDDAGCRNKNNPRKEIRQLFLIGEREKKVRDTRDILN